LRPLYFKLRDDGVETDPARGLALLEKGCELGWVQACEKAARNYPSSDPSSRDKARAVLDRALASYGKGCDLGDGNACIAAANLRAESDPVRDPAKAEALRKRALGLYEKACEIGSVTTCLAAAAFHAGRFGLPANPERRAALKKRACELEPEIGCIKRGDAL
jgi:TPR repeat protein